MNQASSAKSLFEGFFGCIRPILNLLSSKNGADGHGELGDGEDIAFEDLSDLQWLGSGAQGCVFKGYLNKQEVAIKKVKSKEDANLRGLRRLNHENLVRIKGFSSNGDDFFCIIMEFCPYGTLYNYLKSSAMTLKPNKMMNYAKQISQGMSYLHANKIIHRDLKSPK